MANLTTGTDRKRKDGVLVSLAVKNGSTIYKGALACVDATGYVVRGSDTAGLTFIGVAYETVVGDNINKCRFDQKGNHLFAIAAATIADIGKAVFIVDDDTVDLAATTTHDIYCGVIVAVESTTRVWVSIKLKTS